MFSACGVLLKNPAKSRQDASGGNQRNYLLIDLFIHFEPDAPLGFHSSNSPKETDVEEEDVICSSLVLLNVRQVLTAGS